MTLLTATKLARTLDSGRGVGEATPELVVAGGGGERSEEETEEQRPRSEEEGGGGEDAALALLSNRASSERTSVPMSFVFVVLASWLAALRLSLSCFSPFDLSLFGVFLAFIGYCFLFKKEAIGSARIKGEGRRSIDQ